jgi:hypothetical protein
MVQFHRVITVVVWSMLLGVFASVFYALARLMLTGSQTVTHLACWVIAVLLALWPATRIVKKLGLWGDW